MASTKKRRARIKKASLVAALGAAAALTAAACGDNGEPLLGNGNDSGSSDTDAGITVDATTDTGARGRDASGIRDGGAPDGGGGDIRDAASDGTLVDLDGEADADGGTLPDGGTGGRDSGKADADTS